MVKKKTMMLVFRRSLRKTMMILLIGGLGTMNKKKRMMIGFRGTLMTMKKSQIMEVEGSSDGAGKRQGVQPMD